MMFSLSQRTNPATVDHTNLPGNFSQAQVIDPNHLLNAGNGISCAPGNIDSNLCVDAGVVAGPRGDAYLSPTSPAINAGSRSASAAGLGTRTTQANGTLDTGTVDLGWHYEP